MIFFDHDRRRELLPTSLSGSEVQSAKDVIEMHRERSTGEREQTDLPPVWKPPGNPDLRFEITFGLAGRPGSRDK